MVFKVLVLQTLYNLCDPRTEFQIPNRRSVGQFLGLDDGDNVPDETTIWRYGAAMSRAGTIKILFERFDTHLKINSGCYPRAT